MTENVTVRNAALLSPSEQREWATQVAAWTRLAAEKGEAVLAQEEANLEEQMQLGLTTVAWLNGRPAGHVTLWELGIDATGRKWFELGTLFVNEEARGHGIGNQLCEQAAQTPIEGNLAPTTKNPFARQALVAAGLEVRSFAEVPEEIRGPLCYQAPCFKQNGSPTTCIQEHNAGGPCYLLIREPRVGIGPTT